MKLSLAHWTKNSIIIILGSLLGVFMIVDHYFFYWTDPGLLFGINFSAILILGICVPILFMAFAVLLIRKKQNGVMLYGDSVKITFMVFIIGAVEADINSFLFYNVIAPDFYDQHKETYIQNKKDNYTSGYLLGLRAGGASEEKIQLEREKSLLAEEDSEGIENSWKKEKERVRSLAQSLVGLIVYSLFGLLIALFISLFLRKKPKVQVE